MTGPKGNSENFVSWESRETKFTLPQGTNHLVICCTAKQKQLLKNALSFQRQHQATSDHVQQRSTFHG